MKLVVIKKDGTVEDFDEAKIARIAKATGLDETESLDLAQKITTWAKSLAKSKITSVDIRNKIVKELHKIDEYAANLYLWYETTKYPKRK